MCPRKMILSETRLTMRDGVRAFAQERTRRNSGIYECEAKYPEGLFEELGTLGGCGYLEEFGSPKLYRDVRACQNYEGTSDIQRMLIASLLTTSGYQKGLS
jgi:alkylation response protein AidB-like acyl-CoA dehydrogenase